MNLYYVTISTNVFPFIVTDVCRYDGKLNKRKRNGLTASGYYKDKMNSAYIIDMDRNENDILHSFLKKSSFEFLRDEKLSYLIS